MVLSYIRHLGRIVSDLEDDECDGVASGISMKFEDLKSDLNLSRVYR